MSFYSDASLTMIPSGIKDQKVYSVTPTDGSGDLTFSRASNATRVNSSGLVEKVRTNVALYSEDQTAWTDQNQTSVTANAAANPLNGAVTADKVIPSATTDDHYRGLSMGSMVGEISSSIYVKADGYSIIDYGIWNATAANYPVRAVFDLSTQTITQINGSISSITSVGSGWYRISVTGSVASTGTIKIFHRVRPSGTGGTYAGDGTSGMLLWGCQLESGVTTDYIGPTTSAAVSVGPVSGLPRLDYSGGASCPSLLLEPQRSNSVIWSEQIDNAGWTKINGPTITTNIATAPDGYGGADGIQDTTGGSFKRIRQSFSITPNSTNTVSVFVKKETSETNYGGLALSYSNRWAYGIIDAVNGTMVISSDSIIFSTSVKVDDYGDWWRFSLTATDNQSNSSVYVDYYATLSTNGTSTGLGAGSVRTLWGFQLELGASYASSYIPTLSSAVTRVADSASKTGISSLIGQTEGVLYFEGTIEGVNSATTRRIFSLSDGTNANYLVVYNPANTRGLDFVTAIGGAVQCNITSSSTLIQFGQRFKMAIAYAQNDFAFYVNGVQIGIDGNGNVPSPIDKFVFGRGDDAALFEGTNSQLLLFKTRLSNASLSELTTL